MPRHHPRGGALVDVEPCHPRGHLGHDLDRGRPGAEDRDPLAGEVVVVVPPGRVEQLAGVLVQALDVGQSWLGEAACRADQDVGGQLADAGQDSPPVGRTVPACVQHRGAEVEAVEHAGVPGDPPEVGLDLRLGGERSRPVRVRREREAVELRGYVAGRAGIGVVVPGAPDVVRPVQHDEVALPGPVEPDRGSEAAEACADDEHAHVVGQGAGRGRGCSGAVRGHVQNLPTVWLGAANGRTRGPGPAVRHWCDGRSR